MWIDAICIDQNNPQERNHQVRQIKWIFHNAHRVLVWLGFAGDDSDVGMLHIKELAEKNGRAAATGTYTTQKQLLKYFPVHGSLGSGSVKRFECPALGIAQSGAVTRN
jgi:hypothetical protein